MSRQPADEEKSVMVAGVDEAAVLRRIVADLERRVALLENRMLRSEIRAGRAT